MRIYLQKPSIVERIILQIQREHLLHLLASSLTVQQVADKLNVELDDLLEIIKADSSLVQDVARMKSHKTIDEFLDKIELIASQRLAQAVQHENDPMKLLRIVSGVNAARRRSQGETIDTNNVQKSAAVSIILPNRVPLKRIETAQKEIVAIGNKSLESLASNELLAMLKEKQDAPELDELQAKIKAEMGITLAATSTEQTPVKPPIKQFNAKEFQKLPVKLTADEAIKMLEAGAAK